MSSLSFNLSAVTGDPAEAKITLTEQDNGTIKVDVSLLNGTIADLQGVFINIANESLVSGLSVTGTDITDVKFAVNGVTDLGDGVNLNGTKTTFDGGVQIGTSGIGKDDIAQTTFILDHATQDLSIADFIDQTFGVRLTSVNADREGSSKLLGGAVKSDLPATLGDKVFNDINGNGIQEANEAGVPCVTVTLTGAGRDGVLGTSDDTTASQITGADGQYAFTGLTAGDYKVTFSDLPSGFQFTQANAGSNDALDSDADPTSGMTSVITLAAGENNTSVDAGVVAKPASLGDKVFNDANGNGVQDASEGGVQGVKVALTGAGGDGVLGTADDTTSTQVTGSNGEYAFTGLAAGSYKVTFSDLPTGFQLTQANAGSNDALDSDADPTSGMTGVIALAAGENNTSVDAGVVAKPGRIGDRVFNDINRNGIQDTGEAGIARVTVTLAGAGGDGTFGTADDTTQTKQTTSKGLYAFTDLSAGQYKVTFSNLPTGFVFTTANAGNDARDSDADPSTGMTGVITLAPGQVNNTIDAGAYLPDGSGKTDLIGTPAPDTLVGNDGDNNIYGLGESDILRGNGGNDCLFGAGGFDTLSGDLGNDVLDGGQQDDILNGGAGKDTLLGGEGNDNLVGGAGNDILNGSRDGVNGSNEVDILNGGTGSDLFILGNTSAAFYSAAGNADFARILNFVAGEDKVQLQGSIGDYATQQNGADLELRRSGSNELVAVFAQTPSIDLSTDAAFV
jgi:hypothetical protein